MIRVVALSKKEEDEQNDRSTNRSGFKTIWPAGGGWTVWEFWQCSETPSRTCPALLPTAAIMEPISTSRLPQLKSKFISNSIYFFINPSYQNFVIWSNLKNLEIPELVTASKTDIRTRRTFVTSPGPCRTDSVPIGINDQAW